MGPLAEIADMRPLTTGERGLWLLVGAAVLHVAEEYLLDWRSWAQQLSGVALTWDQFWSVNAGFLIMATAAASVGWKQPAISLALPALTLINAVVFHIGPTLVLGHMSPGVVTSALLYVPISSWIFWRAYKDRCLTARVALVSLALGAAVMALPFMLFATGR